jgi:hypothetical protein
MEFCDSSDEEILLELWNPIKIPAAVCVNDDDLHLGQCKKSVH